ncbi:DUF1311 domain-containing protein [Enterobacteriaceae bacterium ESL0689]|nr:DUF1311 domain-containing protein [Enterobacteriaceae bacterium ESL0689]
MKYIFLFFYFPPFFLHGEDICHDVESSDQVFLCSEKKKAIADKYLNEQYLSLLSKVNAEYANDRVLKESFLNNIKVAQRDWIKFRDSNCKLYSFQIDSKSQAYQITFNECVVKMSVSRGKELEGISNDM